MRLQIGSSIHEVDSGNRTLAQLMREVGVGLDLPCNGRGSCGKCKVRVTGQLPDLTDAERRHLSSKEVSEGVRLACQVVPHGDCAVTSYVSAATASGNILVDGVAGHQSEGVSPFVRKHWVSPPAPHMEDQRYHFDRIVDALRTQDGSLAGAPLRVDGSVLLGLPSTIARSGWNVTVAHTQSSIVSIEPGDTVSEHFGVAFDVGTTTLVGYLLNLRTGSQVAVASRTNPQVAHGADLISRITFASTSEQAMEMLRNEVIGALNDIIGELVLTAGTTTDRVYHAVIAGNACMTHMLLGLDASSLATMPYVGLLGMTYQNESCRVGLNIHPLGPVTVLPNIGGFVGSDTVAAIIAAGLEGSAGTSLLIDLGTNGELVLACRGEMLACSTAAGPAFEGAQVVHGMRGAPGAIESVAFVGDEVRIRLIGGGRPTGICGSGLVDAVAELVRAGIVDFTGRLVPADELDQPVAIGLAQRIQADDRGPRFILYSDSEGEISLYQSDIRQLQLAKGAIAAGFSILCKRMGISCADIDRVLLAGAFGNYIDRSAAVRIRMLPGIAEERIVPLGNAAGIGAKMVLASEELLRQADNLARGIRYVELGNDPEFQDEFVDAMMF